MSAVITAAVRAAWDDSRAKNVARRLGCSVITGKRIASTGRVAGWWRPTLIRILDQAIERRIAELEQLHAELKALDHAEMLDRAARRLATTHQVEKPRSAAASVGQGQADGTEATLPLDD